MLKQGKKYKKHYKDLHQLSVVMVYGVNFCQRSYKTEHKKQDNKNKFFGKQYLINTILKIKYSTYKYAK